MSIETLVKDAPQSVNNIRYDNYSNVAKEVLWFVKDVHFEAQPKGLFGYSLPLSTRHVGINENLRHDKNELELTNWHEQLHINGMLDEYAVRATEASASIPALRYKVTCYYN